MRSAVASPAAAVTGGACYTNWNDSTCAPGYTAMSTGVWTNFSEAGQGGIALICAAAKAENDELEPSPFSDTITRSGGSHLVANEPCATCCASGAVVGGIGELPPIAGMGGSPSYNYAIAAVLAFVAVAAFAAGGWYAKKRWGT